MSRRRDLDAVASRTPWRPRRRRATERAHALALALLERHGVLTREAVASEGIVGGFSAVYPVLRALEEAGRVRRGYFVGGPRRRPVRPARRDRPAPLGARLGRRGRSRAGPSPRRGRPGQPVRRRARLAAPRRRRPAGVRPGRRRLRRARRRRRRPCSSSGRPIARDVPGRRRAGGRRARAAGARGARRRRPVPRAARGQGRRPAGRRVAVATGPPRGGLRAGLSRPRAPLGR